MSPYKLKRLDFDLLDYILEMGEGYVLDFSNQTYSEFFNDEFQINIDDERYCDIGTSKGKRLRSFLKQSGAGDILRVLNSLWEYRETKRKRAGLEEEKPELVSEFSDLLVRLGGKPLVTKDNIPQQQHNETLDKNVAQKLLNSLMELAAMKPHPRGFAFESWLNYRLGH